MNAGFDFGTKNIGAALIENNKIIGTYYLPHQGNIKKTFLSIIDDIKNKYGYNALSSYGICGSIDLAEIKTIDSILASVEANKFLKTYCRYILTLGCESYSLIILNDNYNYIEHTVNPLCASGTGSFIDHQADRLKLSTEKLSELAFNYRGKTPSIATRCAVFAKSDIIHSQALGYSIDAITAGLCEGMASGILANLLKGRELDGEVLITGGVSKNKKITAEISKLLNQKVKIIDESPVFNAIGASLLAEDKNFDVDKIINAMSVPRVTREKLSIKKENYPDFSKDKTCNEDEVEITFYEEIKNDAKIFLGIDIGSTSTKLVLLDNDCRIIAGLYTKTAGAPLDAVKKLFGKISKYFIGKNYKIIGVAATGSGRKLVKSILNADLEINEITAHAKAAVFLNPDVDTIIEIGGQDSKFTLLKNGEVVSATMNYVCAAGTGSFIEEQALRLGITLDDISKLAENQKSPMTSDRCTVYMERDLNTYLSEGFSKEEIITAVLHSVRDNYISKVVGKTLTGNVIFFQGATARNKALVSAFENELQKPVIVSKYCHLTGALGAAILLKEKNFNASSFSGINFDYKSYNEDCGLCINKCSLTVFEVNGRKTAWGLKCGRDYEDKKAKAVIKTSSLEKNYKSIFDEDVKPKSKNKTIGIPKALYMYEYYPLFKNYFESLGFNVIVEEAKENIIKKGRKLINSDFCSPIILTHGLLESLSEKNTDYIFYPVIINDQSLLDKNIDEEKFYDKTRDAYFCYYSEYAPVITSNLTGINLKEKIISPKIKMNNRSDEIISYDIACYLAKYFDIDETILKDKFIDSLKYYKEKKKEWKNLGRSLICKNKDNLQILFLGRPYTAFEKEINLGIPEKFEKAGFEVIYQSMIDFDEVKAEYSQRYLDKMHWFYGQEILSAAEIAAKSGNIYPVFLTCFRCSPDAYLINYVKDLMNAYNKPYLFIQLDEHTSDVGYDTRIESAIETFKNHFIHKVQRPQLNSKKFMSVKITNEMNVFIPYLSPVISELQCHAFKSHGYNARVLPPDENLIIKGYKYATGTECMPNIALLGSFIDTVITEKLNPENTILFMPVCCMACNFNQFGVLIDLACEKAGLKNIKISNSNMMRHNEDLPKELNVNLLEVNILGSILYKLLYRFKPYEKTAGLAEKCFNDSFIIMKNYLTEKKSLLTASKEIRKIFEDNFKNDAQRKPRIAILGDLYVKYNVILNQNIYSLIEDIDCEILIPSFTETVLHFIDVDVRENGLDLKYKRGLIFYEKRFEKIFAGLLDDSLEPDIDECYNAIIDYGINHYIAGETSINVGRALYYIKHKLVDAIVHLNPVFCCPGVVSSSIFRRIQNDFGIPIIDLFYDGTNKPNKLVIPQLYYLNRKNK